MSETNPRVAGRQIRRWVDAPQTVSEHASARRQLVDAVAGRKPPRVTMRWAAAIALATLAVVLIGLGLVWRTGEPDALDYTVASGRRQPAPSSYFSPAREPVVLRFTDGSRVQLDPSCRARIAQTTARGASLVLEKGTAQLEIAPRPGANWQVNAGPYVVVVRGTAFSVSWDASTATLEVKMQRGVVTVRGPGIEHGVEVRGTQHFQVRAPTGSRDAGMEAFEGGRLAEAASSMPHDGGAATPPGNLGERLPEAAAPGAKTDEAAAPHAAPSWADLAAEGQYRQIVREAEERGVESVIQSAGLADLWAFADAARITGRGAAARKALGSVRRRFPGTRQAATAAFLLGRMSDQGGSPARALTWYDRYLAEAPGGSFAPEAQGRRMVALRKTKNLEAGKRAARVYLGRYPNGPYAAVAQEILGP